MLIFIEPQNNDGKSELISKNHLAKNTIGITVKD